MEYGVNREALDRPPGFIRATRRNNNDDDKSLSLLQVSVYNHNPSFIIQ